MGEMRTMGGKGDTKISWDAASPDEVANARRSFDDLVGKRYAAWSVKGKNGDKDKRIYAFDPDAERIILVPPMQGG